LATDNRRRRCGGRGQAGLLRRQACRV